MRQIIGIIVFLFVGIGFAYAQSLSPMTDFVTRHAPSTGSDHEIQFFTQQGMGEVGDTLSITFDTDFDLSAIGLDDISLRHGLTGVENTEVLASSPTTTEWGVSIVGSVITFTHPSNVANGDVAPASFVNVRIGLNAGGGDQIINPATLGSEIIRIQTSQGEYGSLAIPIAQDQVGVGVNAGGTAIAATIQWAVPELRIGAPETNDDALFYLTLRTADDSDDVILFTQQTLATLNDDGTYTTPIDFTGHSAGTYDVGIKTQQHLTKVLQDVVFPGGTTILNFSTLDNSPLKGAEVLLGGDVSGAGTLPSNLGDDVVNSVDLSVLLNAIDDEDLTGNVLRPNINQDTVVNSVDLSILIKNLDVEGEN
jgi:hypothetical protein